MTVAKTTRPRVRGIVPRPRLFRLLDQGRAFPVTWIAGPPGAGKTTLAVSYLQTRRLSNLWYQLDEGDADVATLFHYLREATPHGSQRLAALSPDHLPGLRAFAQRFFREMFGLLRAPFAVVLDNYQDVQAPAFHEVTREAIAQVPPGGRLLILSRTGPPPALARLLANRAMHLLRPEDLRLTPLETERLVRRGGRYHLTREALREVHVKADGWTAGIVLLLEQARLGPPKDGERKATSAAVFDYFAGEVFKGMDAAAREVLLQIAFLPGTTASMAGRLTGVREAGRILAALHEENYFTSAHGTDEPVYQLHPLFREFLRAEAQRVLPREQQIEVQCAAAALLEEAGRVEDAAALLLSGANWAALGALVCRHAAALLAQARGQTLLDWIQRMPAVVRDRDPWVLYWQAATLMTADPGGCRPGLERALARFREQRDATGAFLAWAAIVDTYIHECRDLRPLDRWLHLLEELQREFPGFPSPDIEARVVACMLPALYWRQPDHADLDAWVDRARRLFRSHPSADVRLQIALHLVGHSCWVGDFAGVAGIMSEVAGLAESGTASPLLRLIAKTAIGLYQWLTASLERSLATTDQALRLAQATGVHVWDFHISLHAAAAHLSAGDAEAAGSVLHGIAPGLQAARPFDLLYYDFLVAWRALLQRDLPQAAAAQKRALEAAVSIGIPLAEVQIRLLGVWIDLLRTPCPDIRNALARIFRMSRETRTRLAEFSTLLAEASFHFTSGRGRDGVLALAKALRLGREHGYRNMYAWQRPVMEELCVRAMAAGIEPEYVQTLVRERGLAPDGVPADIEAWPWPIKVFTLGRFEVLRDGEPVRFPGKAQKRPLALLKAIIALGGESVSEGRVADLLWADADGDAAQQALTTTLHRLRQLLGHEEAVRRQAGRLSLDRRCVWVDVWALEALLAKAERAIAAKPSASTEVARWSEQAVRLYQGDFLAEDQDIPWAADMAERLRSRLTAHLHTLGRHWERQGNWPRVAECYRCALDINACCEECCRSLMRAYQRLGRRDEALAVYRRCWKNLADRGIRPSPQTVALLDALKA